MISRFDSIETKLATITAALFSKPKAGVIFKKGEISSSRPEEPRKQPTDDQAKKRSEPDSIRFDKWPVEKRSKH